MTTLVDLEPLMQLPGAQAAFQMNDRGELQQHLLAAGSPLDEISLDLLAHMCVANNAIATMQARGWEANADSKGFYPVDGFTMIGMDWSAAGCATCCSAVNRRISTSRPMPGRNRYARCFATAG